MTQFLTGLFAWLGGLFSARPKTTAAAVLIAAAAFVGPWEGERTEAYLDRIASPPVWTVCYGETKGVKAGDKYTPQQCLDMLSTSLTGYPLALEARRRAACHAGRLVARQGERKATDRVRGRRGLCEDTQGDG